MTDRHRAAGAVTATSLAVVAGCVLAVTVKVLVGSPLEISEPRVLDQRALEQHVVGAVEYGASSEVRTEDVTCPTSVTVEVGRTFECDVQVDDTQTTVVVEIQDELGDLSTTTY
jgi:hypothetical protein